MSQLEPGWVGGLLEMCAARDAAVGRALLACLVAVNKEVIEEHMARDFAPGPRAV